MRRHKSRHPLDVAIVFAAGIGCLGVFVILLGFTLSQYHPH